MARYESINSGEGEVYPARRDIKNDEQERRHAAYEIHWRSLAVMLGSHLLGIIFAIGHDRFYHHFDGQIVGSIVHSSREQKIITNVGTAFAFLVKTFFVVAAAIVFSQQLWSSLGRKAEAIHDIDALFDILSNAFSFGNITLWLRHFVLATIAIVCWCIPIAAVFTPGTINVESRLRFDHEASLRPARPQQSWIGSQNFAQTSLDYTATIAVGGHTYADALINGPSGTMYSVALGSASLQDVLSIPAPDQNSTYSLSFFGPAVSCESLSAQDLSTFETTLKAASKAGYLPGQYSNLGRVESVTDPGSLIVKYNAWVESSSMVYTLLNPSWNNGTAKDSSPGKANNEYFYLASHNTSVLLACHLHNASYTTSFSFHSGVQTINTTSLTLHEPVPLNTSVRIDDPDEANYANVVYNAIYYAFNNIMIGAATNDTGTVSRGIAFYGGPVMITTLREFFEGNRALSAPAVIDAIQSLFQNITLSTLSSPALRDPDNQAATLVGTTWSSVNVYRYGPEDLYIAYGCALLATLLCVLWGLFLMFRANGTVYSVKFSTILRTTRSVEITAITKPSARGADDPLPEHMRDVRLRYNLPGKNDPINDRGFEVQSDDKVDRPYKFG